MKTTVLAICCLVMVAGTVWAVDYSKMSTEDLSRMRGTLNNSSQEDLTAFRAEWQKRLDEMTTEQRQQYMEPGRGMGGGHGVGYYHPPMHGQMYQQVDKATQDKLDAFFKDTRDLRKQMMMKQSERQALMQNASPNIAAVSKISGEIFDLQATLRDKAKAAGLDSYMGGPGMGGMMRGRSMAMGCSMY